MSGLMFRSLSGVVCNNSNMAPGLRLHSFFSEREAVKGKRGAGLSAAPELDPPPRGLRFHSHS